MGIKNLSPFLKKYEVYETLHISHLKYKKIGIDTPMFLYKFKSTCDNNEWLGCFIHLVVFLRKWDIHPIFIFEGKAPPEKALTQENRGLQKQKIVDKTNTLEKDLKMYEETGVVSTLLNEMWDKVRQKTVGKRSLLVKTNGSIDVKSVQDEINRRRKYEFSITAEDISKVKELLKIMGIHYIQSKGEAETDCVNLLYSGQIDYVVSEDTDVLAYTNKSLSVSSIVSFNTNEESFMLIKKDKVLEKLEMTADEFKDFCIMCGTDYNKNIFKIGVEKSFKLLKENKRIENLTWLDTSVLNYDKVRQLFTAVEVETKTRWALIPGPDFSDNLNIFVFKHGIQHHINVNNVFTTLSETTDLDLPN